MYAYSMGSVIYFIQTNTDDSFDKFLINKVNYIRNIIFSLVKKSITVFGPFLERKILLVIFLNTSEICHNLLEIYQMSQPTKYVVHMRSCHSIGQNVS